MIRRHDIHVANYLSTNVDDDDCEYKTYDTPFLIENVSLNAISESAEIELYGDKSNKICKTVLDYDEWFGKIKKNDVAYIYGATPEGEVVNGQNANYYVISVLPQNKKIAVHFEEII